MRLKNLDNRKTNLPNRNSSQSFSSRTMCESTLLLISVLEMIWQAALQIAFKCWIYPLALCTFTSRQHSIQHFDLPLYSHIAQNTHKGNAAASPAVVAATTVAFIPSLTTKPSSPTWNLKGSPEMGSAKRCYCTHQRILTRPDVDRAQKHAPPLLLFDSFGSVQISMYGGFSTSAI